MYLGKAKEKRKNRDKRVGTGLAPVRGSCEEEKFPHTRRPLHWKRWRVLGRSFGATEESAATGVQRAKWRDSRTEDQCQTALTSLRDFSAHSLGRVGLGAEAQASEVRSLGDDWGLLHEHSLKGASAPQLGRRESGEKSGTAKEARDFFLPLCFMGCEERGFRAPPKRTPETSVS